MKLFKNAIFMSGLLASSLVQAHAGDHGYSGLMHFLTEPDHVAMMIVTLIAAAFMLKKVLKEGKQTS